MKKALIVGWDGATWDYIDPLLADGRLPNLAKLLRNGVRTTLHSTTPPYTNVAWPSLVTGLTPARTGVFDALRAAPDSYNTIPSNLSEHRGIPIWHWANRYGLRCGVLNVPTTFPVTRTLDGYMVSGFDSIARSPHISYPPGLLAQWADEGHPYDVLREEISLIESQNPHGNRADLHDFVQRWTSLTREQAETVVWLWREKPVDLLFVVFSATDSINHRTRDRRQIALIYEAADDALGRIIDQIDDQTIFCLVSDHGSTPAYRYLSLYRLLHEAGWLRFKSRIATRFLKRLPGRLGSDASLTWQRLPTAVRNLLSWPMLRWDPRLAVSYDNINWRQTSVYVRTGMGPLYINLEGRQPQGIVPESGYERMRDEVIAHLLNVRDGNGQPVFGSVRRAEEVYLDVTTDEDMPDLVFTPARWTDHPITGFPSDPLVRQIPSDRPYGTHTPDGIFALMGPGIERDASRKAAEIVDVVPTILAAMELPLPQDVEGRVLQEAFTDLKEIKWVEALEELKMRRDVGADDTAAYDEIQRRLRALGYME